MTENPDPNVTSDTKPADMPAPGQPPLETTGTPQATRADQLPVKPREERMGSVLPAHPPTPAAKRGTNTPSSPSGPGTPIDGSPSVNTYTPEETQAAEQDAGIQDWQSYVATKVPVVEVPEVTPEDGEDKRASK